MRSKSIKTFFALGIIGLLSSCTNEEYNVQKVEPGTLSFEISIVNSLKTKSGLYSQEAKHTVEDVKIYAFKKSGSDYLFADSIEIPGWTRGLSTKHHQVPVGDYLSAGEFTFIGIGRNATDRFGLTVLDQGVTTYDTFAASVEASGLESEIFAGSSAIAISSIGVRIPIVMTRQVAGILGYFVNVPAVINGRDVESLRLSVTNSNLTVNLTNGEGTLPSGAVFNIINTDLSNQTVNSEGIYTGNIIQDVIKLDNSQLNGSFLIPVNNVQMTLGLYASNGDALKTWPVSISSQQFDILPNNFIR